MRSIKSNLSSWIISAVTYLTLALICVFLSPLGIPEAWADYAGGLGLISVPPEVALTNFFAIVISLTIHEFAHAWVADRMGDPTPARYDRLNLNPITIMKAHPFGALVIPLIGSFNGVLFGFAATPVNPSLVHRKYTMRQAERWISLAGPISNVLLALISSVVLATLVLTLSKTQMDTTFKPLVALAYALLQTNVILALFNMIPVAPLDGFTVLQSSIPRHLSHIIDFIHQYQNMLLIFVFIFGGRLLSPIIIWVSNSLLRGALMLLGIFV